MWNTLQTGGRQRWMPQIYVMKSNAVFLSSLSPCAFVFLPKYRLLRYSRDYINGEHNTPGPHVHTLTIYYETLDSAALKSLLESVVLSRPGPQRWMDTEVFKGSYSMPGRGFPHQLLVWMWEFFYYGSLVQLIWQTAVLLAFLSGEWQALPATGRLISLCLRGDYWIDEKYWH